MNNLLSYERPDYCISCNSQGSIELYDTFSRPVNYSLLVTRYNNKYDISKVLNSRELSYFKCNKCNKIYRIDWRKNYFPIPFII